MEFEQVDSAGGTDLGIAAAAVRDQWPVVLIAVVAAIVAAVIYLNVATYRYAVEMVVTPVQSGGSGKLTGQLGGLASLAGVDLPTDGGTASFQLYVEGLDSRTVADQLARDRGLMRGAFPEEWNAAAKRWQEPDSALHGVATAAKRLLGIPVYPWRAPDAARLQEYLAKYLSVEEKPKKPVVRIALKVADPAFGVALLTALNRTDDDIVRARALRRTTGYIAYLTDQLRVVPLAEHRIALAQLLSEQEKSRMLASSDLPYAAEPFGQPVASLEPTSPKPLIVLGGGLAAGLLIGTAIAIYRYRRRLAV